MWFGGPQATSVPPRSPAPGPKSTTTSASRMVSSSCSTTMTVLPMSRRRLRVSNSRWLSRWCRPMEGSSRMYSTPTKPEPIWEARRMRWASPPDKVCAPRSRVRYPKPMSHMSCKRPRISLSASSAMRALASSKATARKKSRASSMGMAASCGRLRPSILTARDSGRRRPPSHRSQCCTPMYCSNSRRCFSLAPRNFSSRNGMTPSYLSLCDQLEPRRLVYVKVTFLSPRP